MAAMLTTMQEQCLGPRDAARDRDLGAGPSRERGAPLDDHGDLDDEEDDLSPQVEPVTGHHRPNPGRRRRGGAGSDVGPNHHDGSDDGFDLDADVAMVARGNDPDDNKDGDGSDSDGDDFDAALNQLAEEFDGDEPTGKPVSEKLARIVNNIVRAKLAKDKLKDKLNDEAYRKPSNCQNLTVPKINTEMWDRIKPGVRSNDIKAQRLQQMLQKAMVPVILMYEDLRKSHGKSGQGNNSQQGLSRVNMAKYAADVLALLANLNWEMTQQRKDSIRVCLNGQYKQICSETKPFTDLLFGDNLPSTLRDIGTTSRVSQAAAGGTGYQQTYKKGPHSKNGRGRGHWQQNQWQSRRTPHGRGQNWQSRGTSYQFQTQSLNKKKGTDNFK